MMMMMMMTSCFRQLSLASNWTPEDAITSWRSGGERVQAKFHIVHLCLPNVVSPRLHRGCRPVLRRTFMSAGWNYVSKLLYAMWEAIQIVFIYQISTQNVLEWRQCKWIMSPGGHASETKATYSPNKLRIHLTNLFFSNLTTYVYIEKLKKIIQRLIPCS